MKSSVLDVELNSKFAYGNNTFIFLFLKLFISSVIFPFKENIYKVFWGYLLLSVWKAVVNVEWKMIVLLVGWVGKCCSELGT